MFFKPNLVTIFRSSAATGICSRLTASWAISPLVFRFIVNSTVVL